MANWLGNPEHVYGDHPPTLDAGNLGSLVSAILSNKLGERALTQRTLSEAIKAEQQRRQQGAYAEALRNTGLSEGQDFSGLSSADQTRMAQLLEARTPDDEEDAYKAALTNQAEANANRLWTYPQSSGRGGSAGTDASGLPRSKLGQRIYDLQHPELKAYEESGMTPDEYMTPGTSSPDSPVFREAEATYSKDGVKTKMYVRKDDGEYINVNGVRMKYGDYMRRYRQLQAQKQEQNQAQQDATTPPPAASGGSPAPGASPRPGGIKTAPDYGVKPAQLRQMAIEELKKAGASTDEANIQAAIEQLKHR